jgi:hypothetical protein
VYLIKEIIILARLKMAATTLNVLTQLLINSYFLMDKRPFVMVEISQVM